MDVGIRELKAKLSEYLAKASAGQNVIVTDRGKPIAKISSLEEVSPLERGYEEGWVTPPARRHLGAVKLYESQYSVLEVLAEDRE